jgi:hypothetical protein
MPVMHKYLVPVSHALNHGSSGGSQPCIRSNDAVESRRDTLRFTAREALPGPTEPKLRYHPICAIMLGFFVYPPGRVYFSNACTVRPERQFATHVILHGYGQCSHIVPYAMIGDTRHRMCASRHAGFHAQHVPISSIITKRYGTLAHENRTPVHCGIYFIGHYATKPIIIVTRKCLPPRKLRLEMQ